MRRRNLLYFTIFCLVSIGMAGYHLGYYSIDPKIETIETSEEMESIDNTVELEIEEVFFTE